MSWFSELAGKAESLLNNLDEQTGAAIRNHNVKNKKHENYEFNSHNEPAFSPKKRPIPRNLKKIQALTDTRPNNNPSKKHSPIKAHQPHSQIRESHEYFKDEQCRLKKSPTRKSSTMYNLNNCPQTLVGDVKDDDISLDHFGLHQRRYSLPTDLELMNNEGLTYRMQNLEVENAMLKNELNVMNKEVSELFDRLRKTEDELGNTNKKLENSEQISNSLSLDKESLSSQLEQLKLKIHEMTTVEMSRFKEQNQDLETENALLADINKELEEKVRELTTKTNEKDTIQIKLETELRHAQTNISDLQSNLEKSTLECQRLEKDWETYKLRVKSMLYAKDNEIKALQEGMNLGEDTKILIEQLDRLKEEREELSDVISRIRSEHADMKARMEHVESQRNANERVVAALREALRDERIAKNRAEAQCNTFGKELKAIQVETGHTIANLRTALRDKEDELSRLRESTCSVRSLDTSALNVADYDVQESLEREKIEYLTQTLVQRQAKLDGLMADNNMLRIQLEKLETKYKAEIAALRANSNHSVVNFHDSSEARSRRHARHNQESTLAAFSMRIGVFIKRYPIFRLFIIVYMIGLHLWVLTVLLTSTPENYLTRPAKS